MNRTESRRSFREIREREFIVVLVEQGLVDIEPERILEVHGAKPGDLEDAKGNCPLATDRIEVDHWS